MLLDDGAVQYAHDLGKVRIEGVLAEGLYVCELGHGDAGKVRVESVALIQLDDPLDGILLVVLVEDAPYYASDMLDVFLFHRHHLGPLQVAEDAYGPYDLLHLVPFGYGLYLEILVDGDVVQVLRYGDGLLHAIK